MSVTRKNGPWVWGGNANGNSLYLCTAGGGRRIVLAFQRWGMRDAQPVFNVNGRLVPAADLLTFEVGNPAVRGVAEARKDGSVYRLDIRGIDHPDARLIAAAPELLAAVQRAAAQFRFYEGQHAAKGTPDADAKAAVNRALAEEMEALLARIDGGLPA